MYRLTMTLILLLTLGAAGLAMNVAAIEQETEGKTAAMAVLICDPCPSGLWMPVVTETALP